MFNSESFLAILRTSDSVDELQAAKEKVDMDIARQRSKDTGDEDGQYPNLSRICVHLSKQ